MSGCRKYDRIVDRLAWVLVEHVARGDGRATDAAVAVLPIVRELIAEEMDGVAVDTMLQSNLARGYSAKRALTRQAERIRARAAALRRER